MRADGLHAGHRDEVQRRVQSGDAVAVERARLEPHGQLLGLALGEGLHARPAGILSKAAKGFESKVTMTKNGKVADMKKIFAVMGLAVKCGETVTIAADGPDEDAAIEELTKLCKDA